MKKNCCARLVRIVGLFPNNNFSPCCNSSTLAKDAQGVWEDGKRNADQQQNASGWHTQRLQNHRTITTRRPLLSSSMRMYDEVGESTLRMSAQMSAHFRRRYCSNTIMDGLTHPAQNESMRTSQRGEDVLSRCSNSTSTTMLKIDDGSSVMTPNFGTANGSTSSSVGPTFERIASTTNFTPKRTVVTSQRLVESSRDRDSIMEDQPKLMSKDEREEFMTVYHSIVKEIVEIPDMKDMEETNRWLARVLQYNVPHGKRNRGLATALAYKYLAPDELTDENIRLSYVLGWCVEILQAHFLVSDDIMDESETRRGRPCWYKVDKLGLAAVNDALMLEGAIYQILRKNFSAKPYYAALMDVMHDVSYRTTLGQSLDTRTGQDRKMETYTMDRYSAIVKYKTSFYSFYLPVALAMIMAEIGNPKLLMQVRKVTLEMGHFFQVQDDYLDCYGDEAVTGKIGTDIQDCKCSWLFVVAMQRCSPEQKKVLLANYGQHDPAKVEIVKELYQDLSLRDVYHQYEEQTYNLICSHIHQMSEELPKGLFLDMLHKIYKRDS